MPLRQYRIYSDYAESIAITIHIMLRASKFSSLSEHEGQLDKWGEGNTVCTAKWSLLSNLIISSAARHP